MPDRPGHVVPRRDAHVRGIKDRSDGSPPRSRSSGIAKGDRVGIMLPNCPQYIIAAFAILRLGAVVVNINPSYTAREVLTVATDSGIRVLITLDALAPLVLAVKDQTAIEHIIVTSLAEYAAGWPRRRDVERHRIARGILRIAQAVVCSACADFAQTISPCCSTPAARPARRRARC